MGFALKFHLDALSEWDALDKGVREALKKKLAKRLEEPHVPAAALAGSLHGCYKIKTTKLVIDWCTTLTTPKSSF